MKNYLIILLKNRSIKHLKYLLFLSKSITYIFESSTSQLIVYF